MDDHRTLRLFALLCFTFTAALSCASAASIVRGDVDVRGCHAQKPRCDAAVLPWSTMPPSYRWSAANCFVDSFTAPLLHLNASALWYSGAGNVSVIITNVTICNTTAPLVRISGLRSLYRSGSPLWVNISIVSSRAFNVTASLVLCEISSALDIDPSALPAGESPFLFTLTLDRVVVFGATAPLFTMMPLPLSKSSLGSETRMLSTVVVSCIACAVKNAVAPGLFLLSAASKVDVQVYLQRLYVRNTHAAMVQLRGDVDGGALSVRVEHCDLGFRNIPVDAVFYIGTTAVFAVHIHHSNVTVLQDQVTGVYSASIVGGGGKSPFAGCIILILGSNFTVRTTSSTSAAALVAFWYIATHQMVIRVENSVILLANIDTPTSPVIHISRRAAHVVSFLYSVLHHCNISVSGSDVRLDMTPGRHPSSNSTTNVSWMEMVVVYAHDLTSTTIALEHTTVCCVAENGHLSNYIPSASPLMTLEVALFATHSLSVSVFSTTVLAFNCSLICGVSAQAHPAIFRSLAVIFTLALVKCSATNSTFTFASSRIVREIFSIENAAAFAIFSSALSIFSFTPLNDMRGSGITTTTSLAVHMSRVHIVDSSNFVHASVDDMYAFALSGEHVNATFHGTDVTVINTSVAQTGWSVVTFGGVSAAFLKGTQFILERCGVFKRLFATQTRQLGYMSNFLSPSTAVRLRSIRIAYKNCTIVALHDDIGANTVQDRSLPAITDIAAMSAVHWELSQNAFALLQKPGTPAVAVNASFVFFNYTQLLLSNITLNDNMVVLGCNVQRMPGTVQDVVPLGQRCIQMFRVEVLEPNCPDVIALCRQNASTTDAIASVQYFGELTATAAAAVTAAAFVDPTGMGVLQVLAVLQLSGECGANRTQRNFGGSLKYSVSPFYDFGYVAVLFGNVGLVVVFTALLWIVSFVVCVVKRQTPLGDYAVSATLKKDMWSTFQDTFRGPSMVFRSFMLAAAGIVHATVAVASDPQLFSTTVFASAVTGGSAVLLGALYAIHHARQALIARAQLVPLDIAHYTASSATALAASSSTGGTSHGVSYGVTVLFCRCCSNSVITFWALPRVRLQPSAVDRSLGAFLFGSMSVRASRVAAAAPVVSLVAVALSSVTGLTSDATLCVAKWYVQAAMYCALCIATGLVLPHNCRLQSVLCANATFVTAIVALVSGINSGTSSPTLESFAAVWLSLGSIVGLVHRLFVLGCLRWLSRRVKRSKMSLFDRRTAAVAPLAAAATTVNRHGIRKRAAHPFCDTSLFDISTSTAGKLGLLIEMACTVHGSHVTCTTSMLELEGFLFKDN